MKVTSPFAAAAAALGLMAGLALEARASTLSGEVRPYAVAVAWLTPGAPSPAGLEEDRLGARAGAVPRKAERLPRLPAMRASAPGSVPAAEKARSRVPRKVLAGSSCPRATAAAMAARDVRRT
jgi:hypothetical protein